MSQSSGTESFNEPPYKGTVGIQVEGWLFLAKREAFQDALREDAARLLKEMEEYFLAEYDRRMVKRNSVRN